MSNDTQIAAHMDAVDRYVRIPTKERRALVEASARQLAEQPGFVMDVMDSFERRERGIPQAHIAAQLVAEIRSALSARPLTASPTAPTEHEELKPCRHGHIHCLACMNNRAPTAPSTEASEPVGFMSEQQIAAIKDPEGEHGHYIPMRKTPAGNFTLPLYTTPPPAPVLLTDAEIDAITVAQWGKQFSTMKDAHRAYARAIEQSVIARVGRGES